MLCNCTPLPSLSSVPDRRGFSFSVVDKFTDPTCGKACVLPSGRVEVLRSVWDSLNTAEKDALLAHECSHKYCGVTCEHCADLVAGAILRKWGYSRDIVGESFNWIQSRQDSNMMAVRGYDAASGSKSADAYSVDLSSGVFSPERPKASTTTTTAKQDAVALAAAKAAAERAKASATLTEQEKAKLRAVEEAKRKADEARKTGTLPPGSGGGGGATPTEEPKKVNGFPWKWVGLGFLAVVVIGGAVYVSRRSGS